MSQQCLIIQGNILPPLATAQDRFTTRDFHTLFAKEDTDFQAFKKQTVKSWTFILDGISKELLRQDSGLKVSFNVGGPTHVWIETYAPSLSKLIEKINNTGAVSWTAGPMDHSLRFLYHRESLAAQIKIMQAYLKKRFSQDSTTLSLPYHFYSTYLGYFAKQLDIKAILASPYKSAPITHPPHTKDIKVLHAEPWSPESKASPAKDAIWNVDLKRMDDVDLCEKFLTWLQSVEANWAFPQDIGVDNHNIPEWDTQEHTIDSELLGARLEALEHPYCKTWLKQLKQLAQSKNDIPDLHNALLFEALLGHGAEKDAVKAYRSLMMLVKRLG